MGALYNIPVAIYFVPNHPYSPPMAYVRPTASMQIKPGINVDTNGKIYLPYLSDWKPVSLNNLSFRHVNYVLPRFSQDPLRCSFSIYYRRCLGTDRLFFPNQNLQTKLHLTLDLMILQLVFFLYIYIHIYQALSS